MQEIASENANSKVGDGTRRAMSMSGVFPMPKRVSSLLLLIFLLSLCTLAAANQGTTSDAASVHLLDLTKDVRALQRILQATGHYSQTPSGTWDEGTESALRAFQRAHRLPLTGQIDDATLYALGGPADTSNGRPRFVYAVRQGDTLSGIADRFGSSVPWIARYNAGLTSVHHIVVGSEIVVPVPFPFPEGTRVERVQTLPDRFLGTYVANVPFTNVNRLVAWFSDALQEAGFQVEPESSAIDGITLRSRGVVLGRVLFAAHQSNGWTRMDLALLFRRHEDLEENLRGDDWVSP